MQQLAYENNLGERVEFAREPYIFCRVRGLSSTEPAIASLRGAYQSGVTVRSIRRGERRVELTLHIRGDNRADLYRKRQALYRVMAADSAMGAKLYYTNDAGSWWTWAVPASQPEEGQRCREYLAEMRVDLLCESAYWYGVGQSMAAFQYSGAGFSLPFSFPVSFGYRDFSQEVIVGGQVNAPVVVEITGQGETPSLYNATTGQRLRLTAPLPVGHTLRINTDPARLEAVIIAQNGAESSAFALLDVESPLSSFTLRPGINQLVYEPGGAAATSTIRIRWHDRYEGV